MVFDGFKMEYSSHLDVKCNNRTVVILQLV